MPWPGPARITLAVLAVVPAVMAYPWESNRDYWLVGIAAVVVILLFGWWGGLHFTTVVSRRLAMLRRRNGLAAEPATGVRTTAVVRVAPAADDQDVLPLPTIARYLDCYGVRADKIRITSRHSASDARQTWIGLTISAVDNLEALQARSSRIPLQETAQVAARRLADHLRELGWDASTIAPEEVPPLLDSATRETWSAVAEDGPNYVAAYQVSPDDALPHTLGAIRSHPARETWTAVEIGGEPSRYTVAAACAFRTEEQPGPVAPLSGLVPQRGNHGPALMALDPLSTRRLDGHTDAPADLLARLAVSRT